MFTIIFKAPPLKGPIRLDTINPNRKFSQVFCVSYDETGTDLIDKLIAYLTTLNYDMSTFNIENIIDACDMNSGSSYSIEISEYSLLKLIPSFNGKHSISVNVPNHYFNKYIKEKISIYDGRNWFDKMLGRKKTISSINLEFEITPRKEIIMDWIKDGCPAEWGFEP